MPQKTRNAEARARAQARREQIRKAERRRKFGFIGLWSVVGLVVVLVVVFVVLNNSATKKGGKNVTGAAPASVSADITAIPAAAFASAGVQGVNKTVTGIATLSGGTPVVTDGHPTLIYIGGEFCPYCAAERWAIAAALSRFGTLSGLQITQSSGTDVDPNTATLSFVTTKFTSSYLALSATEAEDRAQKPLDTPPSAAEAAFTKYANASFPFVSINNAYQASVQFSPTILKGMTAVQIAASLKDPNSTVGATILASANILTAGICRVTNGQPGSVCKSSEVVAAAPYLDVHAASTGSSGSG